MSSIVSECSLCMSYLLGGKKHKQKNLIDNGRKRELANDLSHYDWLIVKVLGRKWSCNLMKWSGKKNCIKMCREKLSTRLFQWWTVHSMRSNQKWDVLECSTKETESSLIVMEIIVSESNVFTPP